MPNRFLLSAAKILTAVVLVCGAVPWTIEAQGQGTSATDVSQAVQTVFQGVHAELLQRSGEARLWAAYSDNHLQWHAGVPVMEYGVRINGRTESTVKAEADAWFQLTVETYGDGEELRESSNLRTWVFPVLDIVLILRMKDQDFLLNVEDVVEKHVASLRDFQQAALPFQLRLTSPARYYQEDSAIRLDFELVNRSDTGFQVKDLKISTLDCRINGKPWGEHAEGEADWVTLPAGGSLRSSYVISGFVDPKEDIFHANCRYLVGYRDILPKADLRLPVR